MSVQTEINRIKAAIQAAYTAVSGKGGTAPASRTSANLAAAINSIPLGTDTSGATAAAGDILSGKTAYVKGAKVTGTIASQAAQTIMPGTADQTIASGKYLAGTQTIKGDANLKAENIKKGVSIFGVNGTAGEDSANVTVIIPDDCSCEVSYFNGTDFSTTTASSFVTKGAMLVKARRSVAGKPSLVNAPELSVSGAAFAGAAGTSFTETIGMCVPIDSTVTITIS